MPPLDADQLAAEARELEKEISAGDAGAGDAAQGNDQDAAAGDPAQAQEQEHIPNPGPKIAGALKKARAAVQGNALLQRVIPPRAVAVFDDATCDAIGDAFGPLTLKYAPTMAPQLDAFMEKWGPECNAAWILGGVAWRLYGALSPDDEAARADAARDVTPPRAEGRDPPPPGAAGKAPVEPS